MRIFSASLDYINPNQDVPLVGSELDATLRQMNHELIKFYWNLPPDYSYPRKKMEQWLVSEKPKKNRQIIEQVKKANEKKKINLFITEIEALQMYPETIETIKKLGIPTLNFYTDDNVPESQFMSNVKDLALVYDYNWTGQQGAFKNYKKIGAKFIYTPLAANPKKFKPYDGFERVYDVTFTGRNYGYRKKLIQKIADEHIDVHVWGHDWGVTMQDILKQLGGDLRFLVKFRDLQDKLERKHGISDFLWSDVVWYARHAFEIRKMFGKPLSYEDMIKLYSQSKIALNFAGTVGPYQSNFEKAIKTVKGRDIEAPMSGALYLTEYSEEIAQLFEIGKEIETYRNVPELIDKIKYYLENPSEAEAIRVAGRQKTLKEYTWEKCFERLFKEMNI